MDEFVILYVLLVASVFSIVLTALAVRDYLTKKGFWVADNTESETFRVVHSLLYDAEERLNEHIRMTGKKLSNEHRIALINELKNLQKRIEDDRE